MIWMRFSTILILLFLTIHLVSSSPQLFDWSEDRQRRQKNRRIDEDVEESSDNNIETVEPPSLNVSEEDSPYALIDKFFPERENEHERRKNLYLYQHSRGDIDDHPEDLSPEDIWLNDGNLLVLKGGMTNDDSEQNWEPLDDFVAPYREPKLPPPDVVPQDIGVGMPIFDEYDDDEEDDDNDSSNEISLSPNVIVKSLKPNNYNTPDQYIFDMENFHSIRQSPPVSLTPRFIAAVPPPPDFILTPPIYTSTTSTTLRPETTTTLSTTTPKSHSFSYTYHVDDYDSATHKPIVSAPSLLLTPPQSKPLKLTPISPDSWWDNINYGYNRLNEIASEYGSTTTTPKPKSVSTTAIPPRITANKPYNYYGNVFKKAKYHFDKLVNKNKKRKYIKPENAPRRRSSSSVKLARKPRVLNNQQSSSPSFFNQIRRRSGFSGGANSDRYVTFFRGSSSGGRSWGYSYRL